MSNMFGSRLDDNLKGGDIDLLVFSQEMPYKVSQEISVNFFKKCEEKIDVIKMPFEELYKKVQITDQRYAIDGFALSPCSKGFESSRK